MNVSKWSLLRAAGLVTLAVQAACAPATAPPAQTQLATRASADVGRARGGGFTGNWPLTVTRSKYDNGNHCVALTDYSSGEWKYSGTALLDGKLRGSFQVIGSLIEITVDDGGYSQNAGSVYSGILTKNGIGSGAFVEVYGGEAFDEGKVAFGKRGGC